MTISQGREVRRTGVRRLLVSVLVLFVAAAPWVAGPRVVADDGSDDVDRYVVTYRDDVRASGRAQTGSVQTGSVQTGPVPTEHAAWTVVEAGPTEVAALRADPSVAAVEPDHEYRLARGTPVPGRFVATGNTQVDPPWGLDRIDQRERELSGTFTPVGTGAGVVVYVVDDGIDGRHADFGGRVRSGWSGVVDPGGPEACSRHGSHVAGVIGGTVSGVAKEVTLVPVRVFGCESSSSLSTLLAAIDWILQQHDRSTPGVVNLSIEGPPSAILDDRISTLVEHGLVVVVAAGNGARPACDTSPARAAGSIAVGATEISDRLAWFSNYGSCVDLFAPGVGIRSVSLPSGLELRSGTSMAAPHVAGAAALILSEFPGLTPTEVRERLIATATPATVIDAGPGSPDRLVHVASTSDPAEPLGTIASSLAPFGPGFVGAVPERVLDTRNGGQLAAGSISRVPLVGRDGVPAGVIAGVGAVVLNVTVVDPAGDGYLTVFPCDTAPPETSNVNFTAGRTVANAVLSQVASGGICVYASAQTHVLVDVAGSIVSGFVGRPASRVVDTRSIPTLTTAMLPAGSVLPVDVRVPADATAVMATVTAVGPIADGYLTVFACGPDGRDPAPGSSNVNFTAGRTVANAVVSAVGPGGHLCVYTSADTHVLVDVSGHSTSRVSGQWPERVLDTRPHARLAGGTVGEVGVSSSPIAASGASAVVMNVTVVDPVSAGFVTVYPCGVPVPDVSNINVEAGATVANAVVSGLGRGGEVCVYSSVDTHVLVDVVGAVG